MKILFKLFTIICLASMSFVSSSYASVNSEEPLTLEATIIDPLAGSNPHKGPVQIPKVSLDDHTLYFSTPCDGYTLNLVDENDVVVYTIVIPTGTTSWVLPTTLSGEYELQLISGNYCFWGMITL